MLQGTDQKVLAQLRFEKQDNHWKNACRVRPLPSPFTTLYTFPKIECNVCNITTKKVWIRIWSKKVSVTEVAGSNVNTSNNENFNKLLYHVNLLRRSFHFQGSPKSYVYLQQITKCSRRQVLVWSWSIVPQLWVSWDTLCNSHLSIFYFPSLLTYHRSRHAYRREQFRS